MATESRTLRPYKSLDELDTLLSEVTLEALGETIESGGRLTLDFNEYLTTPIRLRLGADGLAGNLVESALTALKSVGLDPETVLFTVNLYSGFLKISEYLLRIPITQLPGVGESVEIASAKFRPAAMQTPHSGCRIEVAVVLGESREPVLLQPWRKGAWLCRNRFHVSCDVEFAGFTPKPMDLEQKAALGLPAGATRYVTLAVGVDPLDAEARPDDLELWVDAELLGIVAAQPRSAFSVAFQRQLFVDAVGAIARSALDDAHFADVDWTEIEDSFVGRIIRGIAGHGRGALTDEGRQRCSQILQTIRDDHARFMTHVEQHAQLTSSYVKAMQH